MQEAQPLNGDTFKMLSYCPLCNKEHPSSDANMLGIEGDMCVWHVRCRFCSNAMLALILKNKDLVSSVGIVTDLSCDDISRITNQSSVSLDDVLRAHQAMSSSQYLKEMISA